MPPGFATRAGAARLGDLRRYLRAAQRRLERLPDGLGADVQKMGVIHELEALAAGRPDVEDAPWLLEELRVSQFAESLGVKGQVSAKRIRRLLDVVIAAALASLALLAPPGWAPDTAAAGTFAAGRAGEVSFAVRTERRAWGRAPDTRRPRPEPREAAAARRVAPGRGGPAPHGRRAHRSPADDPRVEQRRGDARRGAARARAHRGAARAAGMPAFRLADRWGLSATTAREQARFFLRVDRVMPARHRAYGMRLLRSVIPAQRWGAGQAVPSGWTAAFKGGWTDGSGLSEHQVALLTRGEQRVAVAVTSTGQPDHALRPARAARRVRPPARRSGYGTMTPVSALRAAAISLHSLICSSPKTPVMMGAASRRPSSSIST